MAVILSQFKLFYGAVPKVACTSIKRMFFEAENRFEFRRYIASGQEYNIHNAVYKTMLRGDFPEKKLADFHRVAVVRDPIKRFLSSYSNRVVFHKELSNDVVGKKIRELDLVPDPDLETFIEKFESYKQASKSISHHTRPMVDFVGSNESYFARVYRIQQLDEFVQDMNERMGTTLTLGRHQTGGPKIGEDSLQPRHIKKLKAFYEEDYASYGKYF